MSSISFRDFTLNQTAITGKRNPKVLVTETRPRYKINPETRQRTDQLEGYTVDIIARMGKSQSVKLGLDCEKTIQEINDNLKQSKLVYVNFGTPSTLRGKCYAMISDGQILSGVSCVATDLNIADIQEQEDIQDDIVDFDD